jgi:phenylacetic acid degradation protein
MNAVIMDDVQVGAGCIVGALSFLKAGSIWPERRIIAGNPAKDIGPVSDEMFAHKVEGTSLYQQLPQDCHDTLREATPLPEAQDNRPASFPHFETWQQRRKGH